MPILHILENYTLDQIEAKMEELEETLKGLDPDDDEHDIISGRQEDFFIARQNLVLKPVITGLATLKVLMEATPVDSSKPGEEEKRC